MSLKVEGKYTGIQLFLSQQVKSVCNALSIYDNVRVAASCVTLRCRVFAGDDEERPREP